MTDTERFLAWAAEVSTYLAEKLPQLEKLHGRYFYPSKRDIELDRCSCILAFEIPPTVFVTDIVLPGLREIHARHTDDLGDPISFFPDWCSYELTWKKIPIQVAKHAQQFCPTSGEYWPRFSITTSWPMEISPFSYGPSWGRTRGYFLTAWDGRIYVGAQ